MSAPNLAARSRVRSAPQEKANLLKKTVRSWLVFQEQMVSTGQGDEMSARDTGGQLAPGLNWSRDVPSRMHDKRRRLHFRQKISDIEIADDVEISSSALGRGRFQLQLVEILCLLVRSARNESRGEHLPKAWIIHAPPEAHQSRHRLPHFFLSRSALLSAESERAIQNENRPASDSSTGPNFGGVITGWPRGNGAAGAGEIGDNPSVTSTP